MSESNSMESAVNRALTAQGMEPVAVRQQRGRLIISDGDPAGRVVTNLQTDTAQGQAILFNATGRADRELGEMRSIDLNVTAYIVHREERVDPISGEVNAYSRLVLVEGDGKTFATTSATVAHQLAKLMDMPWWGPGPWSPPIPVTIRWRRKKTGQGEYQELLLRVT